jgi:hypothetical protein
MNGKINKIWGGGGRRKERTEKEDQVWEKTGYKRGEHAGKEGLKRLIEG